jgi:hypothetical protein
MSMATNYTGQAVGDLVVKQVTCDLGRSLLQRQCNCCRADGPRSRTCHPGRSVANVRIKIKHASGPVRGTMHDV